MKKLTKPNQHIKFTIRLQEKVTSLTLKKNIITLWFILNFDQGSKPVTKTVILDSVSDFIDSWKDKWTTINKKNGKGLSDYITEKMVYSFLDSDDLKYYKETERSLK
jgi:hypothetical protein